jgi:hypothetical protein
MTALHPAEKRDVALSECTGASEIAAHDSNPAMQFGDFGDGRLCGGWRRAEGEDGEGGDGERETHAMKLA